MGVEVEIAVDVQTANKTGFDDVLQLALKESCNVLGFSLVAFE